MVLWICVKCLVATSNKQWARQGGVEEFRPMGKGSTRGGALAPRGGQKGPAVLCPDAEWAFGGKCIIFPGIHMIMMGFGIWTLIPLIFDKIVRKSKNCVGEW